jgi:hypothetical protein
MPAHYMDKHYGRRHAHIRARARTTMHTCPSTHAHTDARKHTHGLTEARRGTLPHLVIAPLLPDLEPVAGLPRPFARVPLNARPFEPAAAHRIADRISCCSSGGSSNSTASSTSPARPSLKPVGYTWSYSACETGHLVRIAALPHMATFYFIFPTGKSGAVVFARHWSIYQ